MPVPPSGEGVFVGFNNTNWNDSTVTWAKLTSLPSSIQIDRGRQFELSQTQTGTATVVCQDINGVLDSTNTTGAHYGKILPMKPIAINLKNPVTNVTYTMYTGFVESWDYTMEQNESIMQVTIRCVDGFDPLGAAEVIPDTVQGTGPADQAGTANYIACQVDDRIFALLADAGWPTGPNWNSIFSGNVAVQSMNYQPGTSILTAMWEAAEAEFPGVANIFIDKLGRVVFHGRLARFDPTNPTYGINTWVVGDQRAITTGSTGALIKNIAWTMGMDNQSLINASLATPQGILDTDISGQLAADAPSITQYGTRQYSMTNLITLRGDESPTPFNANEETSLYAEYYTVNYNDPRERLTDLSFGTVLPTDTRSQGTWAFMLGVEISDVLNVYTHNPGGGGFNGMQFFVEGLHYTVAPMQSGFHEIALKIDTSPQAWFSQFPTGPT